MTVSGIATVTYCAGVGPDVVYLHGGGTFHGFEFARDWLSRFRVWLPYLPGFGESADAPSLHTLDEYVRYLSTLFDALGLGRFHLVGASLGGLLAAKIAVANPERVRTLVLVAPAGIILPAFPMPDFSRIAHRDWPGYLVDDAKVIRPFWPDDPDPAFVAAWVREAQTSGRLIGEALETQAQFVRSLKSLTAPTLLAWGKQDRMVPAGNAGAWLEHVANPTVKIMDHSGHLLLDESAATRSLVAHYMTESGQLR
jgi:pimeloyl-ACP methyl ester carboxylesterase